MPSTNNTSSTTTTTTRIQVSSNDEFKDKIIDHGCDLLNRHELSSSQNRELQRFIDANSDLLKISDKEREEREKKEKMQNRYANNSLNRLSYGSSYSDYGTGRKSVGTPASDYGTGRRKEVSWSDGVRARSHSPSRSDGEGYDNNRANNNAGRDNNGYGRGDHDNDSLKNRQNSPAYSSLDRRDPHGNDRDRNRRGRSTESPWKKPYVSPQGSNDNLSSSGKPWHKYITDRELSPAYSTLQRHPDDYNRYETKKFREQENQKFRWDDTARFYGYGDRVGSGIELTPKRWTGGEIISDPTFIKKSLKPRRVYYSPIGDGVVEADGIEMKRGPKDMSAKRYVTHERYLERGSGGHGGVRIFEKRWDEDVDDGSGRGGNKDGYGGPPFDDGMGDKNRGGPYGNKKPYGDDEDPYGSLGRRSKPDDGDGRGSSRGPLGDDDGFPRSGRSSAMSIGTDGFPRQGWTKTFIVNPRELINQYGNETNTSIFDLEDHTPKTITTTKETLVNTDHEEKY